MKNNREEIRTEIFKLFKRGYTYKEIAKDLNANGYRTNRGTRFAHTNVQTFCNYHKLYRTQPGTPSLHIFRLIQKPSRRTA